MSCQTTGNLTICRRPAMEEVRREKDGETRWCFQCRKRVDFDFVLDAPVEPSCYGPSPRVECQPKGHVDGDCGFGGSREWDW